MRWCSAALEWCVWTSTPNGASEIAEEVGGVPWSGDATVRADVERLLEHSVGALGQVYGLIDIIGMAEWGFIVDMDDGVWDRQMAINLRHAYLLGQVFGSHMVANGEGSMVFIASASGMDGAPNHAAYGAAKAGLMAWVKSMAVEMGPHRGSGQRGGPRRHRHPPDHGHAERCPAGQLQRQRSDRAHGPSRRHRRGRAVFVVTAGQLRERANSVGGRRCGCQVPLLLTQ